MQYNSLNITFILKWLRINEILLKYEIFIKYNKVYNYISER